jgi:hypothetical protein
MPREKSLETMAAPALAKGSELVPVPAGETGGDTGDPV